MNAVPQLAPFATWTPPAYAELFKGTDYANDIREGDLFCTRCGQQTVRARSAHVGGRGYQTVQFCQAWWQLPDGSFLSCGDEVAA